MIKINFNRFVLDCKLGFRTFLESETTNQSQREDLYDKANALAPWLLTEEEKEARKITKFRCFTRLSCLKKEQGG